RAAVRGADDPGEAVARLVDLDAAVEVLRGKIEFEPGEEGRESEILRYLLRTATVDVVRGLFRGIDMAPLVEAFDGSVTLTTGASVTATEFLAALPELSVSGLYDEIADRVDATNAGQRAGAIELALEGLYLSRRLSKETGDGAAVYG
ncbi:magnesium chelatase, partial [Dietzia cinnamea]|nr:magnesium chelatase [Dietzia cinnamea]